MLRWLRIRRSMLCQKFLNNDETPIKRGRGRPKKLRVEVPEEENPNRRSPRTKEQIEEDKHQPHIRKKK